MKRFPLQRRTWALLSAIIPVVAVFAYVAFRSGPLAAIPVTTAIVELRALSPAAYGIGTVEARYTYKIGPTAAGRLQHLDVDVGDRVRTGQVLGAIDPVDLDERIAAQQAELQRAEAGVRTAEARIQEAAARRQYTAAQAQRYGQLREARSISEENAETKQQEFEVAVASLATAQAGWEMARRDCDRARANIDALLQQRAHLQLVSPVDGLVTLRHASPGSTLAAGQTVLDLIDPASVWINVRFDPLHATKLRAGLPARIALRSREGQILSGLVLRVDPVADIVTEEVLAMIGFERMPEPLPSIGELAEVTVALPELPPAPVVPNVSVRRVNGRLGVWRLERGDLAFAPVSTGAADLDGHVQALDGLEPGAEIVVYSPRALGPRSRVNVVQRLPGISP